MVMSRIKLNHSYNDIIGLENLLIAWKEFLNGKRNRKDVQEFSIRLMNNITQLHEELSAKTYKHSTYHAFNISDPKLRRIHKAKVRDRLLHHAICRILYPFFDRVFISDSFSCRLRKGTHRAINKFTTFARKESKNYTKTVWVLKCDIRKFFPSIDHEILLKIISDYIIDENIVRLIEIIVGSFYNRMPGVGLPLGNLTSQLLVNIYMNRFDQFVKYKLKARHYIRYADDFVFISSDKKYLQNILPKIEFYLMNELKLNLHPDKVSVKTLSSGIDYLGWVHFPGHRVLRSATKRRMLRNLADLENSQEVLASYVGLLKHGNAYKLNQLLD